ncbi:hypothetical protein DM860_004170 [Cuscuta australis]|uniref:Uncharacterized protein n=1 Tax=Cuscuta australis TaxID=267555 RepID=A0A328CXT5_9ASTE|nr:hypothetical protein DM860_004170 [Cuscuta australis]
MFGEEIKSGFPYLGYGVSEISVWYKGLQRPPISIDGVGISVLVAKVEEEATTLSSPATKKEAHDVSVSVDGERGGGDSISINGERGGDGGSILGND